MLCCLIQTQAKINVLCKAIVIAKRHTIEFHKVDLRYSWLIRDLRKQISENVRYRVGHRRITVLLIDAYHKWLGMARFFRKALEVIC